MLSERLMRAELAALPDGVYAFEDFIDGFGDEPEPLRIAVELTVRGDEVWVDLEGTAPQVAAGLNCPVGMVNAGVYCAFRGIADREIPNAERLHAADPHQRAGGHDREPGAAGGLRCARRRRLPRLRRRDGRARAGRAGEGDRARGGRADADRDRRLPGREARSCSPRCSSAAGAPARRRDGLEGVSNPLANLSNQPVEMVESELPLRVHGYGLVADSGGPGRFRGGLAYERSYELLADEAVLTVRSDRRSHPPYGIEGGEAGAPSSNTIVATASAPSRRCRWRRCSCAAATSSTTSPRAAAAAARRSSATRRSCSRTCSTGRSSVEAARERYGVVIATDDRRAGAPRRARELRRSSSAAAPSTTAPAPRAASPTSA